MIHYQLNMGRGFLMPLELRRKWLHWVALYLVLMAVAIAFVLYQVVDRALYWRTQSYLVSAQAKSLLSTHPEYKTVGDYKKALDADVSASTRDLESIVSFSQTRRALACNLMSFVKPLPPGLGIGAATYDAEARKLAFEVIMPVSLKLDESITPQKLMALWERTPCLSNSVIELANSERSRTAVGEVMCWRFSAVRGGP